MSRTRNKILLALVLFSFHVFQHSYGQDTATTTEQDTPTTIQASSTIDSTPGTTQQLIQCEIKKKKIQKAGRIVFGEARGEPLKGQLAVAYTIVNRINHKGYPNTFWKVVKQKYGKKKKWHAYNTLDNKNHSKKWKKAKKNNTQEYKNAIQAATDALCKTKKDPTNGATDFCAKDPCSATMHSKFYCAVNKIKIGNHWFVGREENKTGKKKDCED